MDRLIILFKKLVNYQNRVKTIHWNAAGPEFDSVHNVSDELAESLLDMIDTCAEMIKRLGGCIPIMKECVFEDDETFSCREFNKADAYYEMNKMVLDLISAFEAASSTTGMLRGIQSEFDGFEYALIKESYKLKQRLKSIE